LNPESPISFYYLGECANRLGRAEDAVEALERTIELEPESDRAYRTLGILFDRMRQPDRAAEMYRRSRELKKKS
jgi:tetratricopeptide (TPR) repeat protein